MRCRSGSTIRKSAPATNAPRIASSPRVVESTKNTASSATATRTPSCALVSSNRISVPDTRIDAPARVSARPITITSPVNVTRRKTVEPIPDDVRGAVPQPLRVDLEPGEEQEEAEPEQREDVGGNVDAEPVKTRWAHHDAEHDLEHNGGKAQRRRELDDQRREHRDDRDREHRLERELGCDHHSVRTRPP